jgi:hypothetical protein
MDDRQSWLMSLKQGDKVALNDSRIERIRHITENGHCYVGGYTFNCLGEMVGNRNHKIYPVSQELINQIAREGLFVKIKNRIAILRSTELSLDDLSEIAEILKIK